MIKSHTGASYVDAISARASDRCARSAFQGLVRQVARPGAALFDFGAGPGLDARFYAECGFTVGAYDVDPQMCAYFSVHCREFIRTGRVSLDTGSYQEFLARESAGNGGPIELVTSNFAPLNLVGDLRGLFAKFHSVTAPHGKILASVLSPYFVGDVRYGWWWRNLPRLWREGRFAVPGAQGSIVRRRLADFTVQSAPHFVLTRVFPGRPPHPGREAVGIDMSSNDRFAWLRLSASRFMFLLFEKRERR
jgi:SAM-dependent methyltransferase